MKAKIEITGGIGGNSAILNKLGNYTDWTKTRFGGFVVYYSTVTEARQDLKSACRKLKQEDRDASFYSDSLSYDASRAEIIY